METIRNYISIALGLLLTTMAIGSQAQDYTKIQKAFEESYALENSAELNRAVEALKKIYDENSYEINLRLGWLSYSVGNFSESMAYYQKSITLRPLAVEARLGLTYPSSAMGNWDMVKQQYIEILEIDPMNTTANYYLGLIYYNREEYQQALKYFEKVANLYPFDYDGMLMFAWTNYRLGKLREATVLFNKVLMIKPGDESAAEGLKLIQ